jgi:hypothetical protein
MSLVVYDMAAKDGITEADTSLAKKQFLFFHMMTKTNS